MKAVCSRLSALSYTLDVSMPRPSKKKQAARNNWGSALGSIKAGTKRALKILTPRKKKRRIDDGKENVRALFFGVISTHKQKRTQRVFALRTPTVQPQVHGRCQSTMMISFNLLPHDFRALSPVSRLIPTLISENSRAIPVPLRQSHHLLGAYGMTLPRASSLNSPRLGDLQFPGFSMTTSQFLRSDHSTLLKCSATQPVSTLT